MDRDARLQRGERPFVFSNLKTGEGLDQIIAFIREKECFKRLIYAEAKATMAPSSAP